MQTAASKASLSGAGSSDRAIGAGTPKQSERRSSREKKRFSWESSPCRVGLAVRAVELGRAVERRERSSRSRIRAVRAVERSSTSAPWHELGCNAIMLENAREIAKTPPQTDPRMERGRGESLILLLGRALLHVPSSV